MVEKINLCRMVKAYHCSAHRKRNFQDCQYQEPRYANQIWPDCLYHTLQGECTSYKAKKADDPEYLNPIK